MKERLKKQRRKIAVKIACVLISVWLIVSLVFSAVTLYTEKQTQLTSEHNNYDYFIDVTTGMAAPPYNEIFKYVDVVKSNWRDIVSKSFIPPEITCGAEGTFDENLQIVLYEYDTTDDSKKMLMDSDKETFVAFSQPDYSDITPDSGILNYDEFVSSMTQEQLDTITEYLNTKKDQDGYYYVLTCSEVYYNPEDGHIYPKTVKINKAHEEDYDSIEDEVIETFSLNPENTNGLGLYTADGFIEGQFVCNNYSSGGLITDPYEPIDYTLYDPDYGIVEKDGLFTYIYTNGGTYHIETVGFEGSGFARGLYNDEEQFLNSLDYELLFADEINELMNEYNDSVEYLEKQIGVRYVKRINLLECAKDTLIVGISVLFLFFLIIGIILTVMMWKLVKTEMLEEEKRRETTNALAHDIKTPLFIISGYAQNLKENTNPEKQEHYIDRIIERTDEVNKLVHKMLDFSRLGTVEQKINCESVNIKALVQDAVKDYEALPNGKTLELKLDTNCVRDADRALLSRAVSYLLDNAIKYSDESTEITVELCSKSLSISNECSTITQEDIKHITEPYYRVEKNRESKGNGLGLSIVKSIVELHNFKLDISLIDSIITFTISFS